MKFYRRLAHWRVMEDYLDRKGNPCTQPAPPPCDFDYKEDAEARVQELRSMYERIDKTGYTLRVQFMKNDEDPAGMKRWWNYR